MFLALVNSHFNDQLYIQFIHIRYFNILLNATIYCITMYKYHMMTKYLNIAQPYM